MNIYYDVEDNHYRTYPDGDKANDNQIKEMVEGKKLSIIKLQQENKQLKEVINKAIERINDYKIYCKENYGFTQYTDIEIEAIKPILIKMEDILKEVSE